jgi:hypothetical protein
MLERARGGKAAQSVDGTDDVVSRFLTQPVNRNLKK